MRLFLVELLSSMSLCLHTESERVNITSLVLCHLEAINVIRLFFKEVKIYIDALMVLIKIQQGPSTYSPMCCL